MTSRGERAVRELMQEKNGSEWTATDIRKLIFAFADDQEADHEESMERMAGMEAQLADHIAEAVVRDRRITNLEIEFADRRKSCPGEVKELIAAEHKAKHDEYVASLAATDFNGRLVWFFATQGGKFLLVLLGLLAAVGLNLLVYGRP